MTTEQALKSAKERHLAGELIEARRLYELVLQERPDDPAILFRMGLLAMQERRLADAADWIERTIAVGPAGFPHYFALGQIRSDLQQHPGAADAFRKAVAFKPDSADAHFGLGLALQSLGEMSEAIAAYRSALQLRPAFASALSNLGSALSATGCLEEAIGMLREAARIEPEVSLHQVNLGAALCRLGKFAEAETVLRQATRFDPASAPAAYNLGIALGGLGLPRDAIGAYRRAIELRAEYADAYNNLGAVCKELGEFPDAAAAFDTAIRLRPASVVGYNNLGCLLRTLGRLEQAEDVLRKGLALRGESAALCNNLASVLKDAGSLDEAIECYRKALALDPLDAGTHSNLAYSLSFQATDGQIVLEECRRWDAIHAAPLRRANVPPERQSYPDRRLRVGYVSGDFRDHCQSLFTIPLLSHHDREHFEIFCYSSVERPDDYTRQIAGYADVWRDVRHLDDAGLAEMIRRDRIDVLVDLGMHMATGRPLVFARRPAPVQVAWLAYPGTTGISSIDCRLTDPRLDPEGFDNQYTERSIRLPNTFWCYDPLLHETVNALPATANGFVTFGCLNNPCKLTDRTLTMWAGVLKALPTARLMLMTPPGRPSQRLAARLAAIGISIDRISFRPFRPRQEYLRTYHTIDLGLDTFPYNGHTTSLDSFWMGVPVVTRVGQTAVGRGGLSQLYNLGLCELAADSDEGFVEIAVQWANDLNRLAELRRTLRGRMEDSPLMDFRRFAQDIKAAYRRMWGDHSSQSHAY